MSKYKAYTEDGNFYGYFSKATPNLGLTYQETKPNGVKLELWLPGGGLNFYTAFWDDPYRGAIYNTPTFDLGNNLVRGGWMGPHPDWQEIDPTWANEQETMASAELRRLGVDPKQAQLILYPDGKIELNY